ncbi:MAG: DUF1588 domain-containing protein [Gemmataceae bacterium]
MNRYLAISCLCALGLGSLSNLPLGAAPDGLDAQVLPFLRQHCFECHANGKAKGDVDLSQLGNDLKEEATADLWSNVLRQIVLGQMPPARQPRPDALASEQVVKGIDATLVKAGHDSVLHGIVTHPSFGNYIDHDLLFSGKLKGPAYSPSRLWRRSAYNAAVGAFPLPARTGIRDFAGEGYIDEPTLDSLIGTIAGKLTRDFDGTIATRGSNKGKIINQVKQYVDYFNSDKPTAEHIQLALARGFTDALQREPNAEELKHYMAMLEANVAKGGKKIGLKTTLMAIFLNPESVFRMELGLGPQLEDGRRMLSPQELYFAISFALGDQPLQAKRNDSPDHVQNLLKSGKLQTRADVERAVRHLLKNKQIDKPRIYRFFHEFFSFQETETIFKDAETSYQQRKYMMADGAAFIDEILASDQRVFEQLLTKSEYPLTVVRGKKTYTWPMLRYSYSMTKEQLKVLEEQHNARTMKNDQLPKDQQDRSYLRWDFKEERAGMLCHPTWLFAWSTNNENHPVQRGKWILEHLLAGTMPEVPITVQAQVPEDPHRTLRERFVETREKAYCLNCHKKMNPLGMTFECYDFMGKFRTTEVGKPVDASGSFDGTGIPGLDGKGIKVKNAVELMDALAKMPRVRQSIIRHAFRYWMGRNEMLSDAPTLIAAERAYLDSGGSFDAVVLSLLTSDSFLYRR